MSDSTAYDGNDQVAVLAALFHILASGAEGSRGRERWDGLVRVVNSHGATAVGGKAAGVAELAALRHQPDDTKSAETLARVLLARSDDDALFRDAFTIWHGQEEIQATERSLHGAAGGASASSPAQRTSPQGSNGEHRHWWQRLRGYLSGPWQVAIGVLILGIPATILSAHLSGGNSPSTSSPSASYSPTGNAPVQINSVQVIPSVQSRGMVLPEVIRLSKAQFAQLNQMDRTNWDAYSQIISKEGGVRLGISQVEIAVTGNVPQSARITGIRVVDRSCRPPLAGTLFYTGGGQGEGSTIPANFNLDIPDPVALTPSGVGFFAGHTITLSPGEKQTLVIGSVTENYYCQYELQLSVLVGSRTTMETVNDHGKRFQALAAAPFSRYGAIYVGGSLNTGSIYGAFVSENPATYKGGLVGHYPQ
jgi:hypothetical protein